MLTTAKPLMALCAGDLMSESPVIIPEEMSLQAAAHLLSLHQISGAPVVDRRGRCVGVLSAMDFVHWAQKGGKPARSHGCEWSDFCQSWQIMEPDHLPEDAVANCMTRDPVTVSVSARLPELARMMVDAHIHRIVVVNEQGQPKGVVSSTDILAAVAYADPATGAPPLEKGAVV